MERLTNLVRYLVATIAPLYLGGPCGGRIPMPLLSLMFGRLKRLQDGFAHLAGRIAAGTYRPRRFTPRRGTAAAKPPPKSPLQKSGWLAELLPDAVAAPLRGHLLGLLEDPEVKALIAAAPAPMARMFRPLCWALKLKPPEILARPKRPAAPAPPPAMKKRPRRRWGRRGLGGLGASSATAGRADKNPRPPRTT
jgi:hypothetical protein